MAKAIERFPKSERCPICRGAATPQYRPFCSKRCADIDLARWFGGDYAVPVVELDEKDLDELEQFVDGVLPDPDSRRDDGY